MRTLRICLAASCAAFLLAMLVCPAHAQFGGLGDRLKKRAAQAVTGKPAATAPAAAEEERVDTTVVTITPEALAAFEKGVQAEAVQRAVVVKKLAALKTKDQYGQCQGEFMMSETGRKVMTEMQQVGTDAEKMRIAQQHYTDGVLAHCGPDPGDYEFRRHLQASIPLAGFGPSGFSPRQYSILHERVLAYLAKGERTWHTRGQDGPGMYVFTAAELEALHASEARLRELLGDQL